MKIALGILAALVVVIVAIVAYAATKPDRFRVTRSLVINAPASAIFPYIEDFRRWAEWSPYEKLDPAMTKTLSGAATGPGAVYEWAGNSKAGQGRMEILRTAAPGEAVIDLRFEKPMRANNQALFTLTPEGQGTRVTWAMEGESPLVFKVMSLFLDMDNMIGRDFAEGLANLKSRVEARP